MGSIRSEMHQITCYLIAISSASIGGFVLSQPAQSFSDSDTRTQYATTYAQFRNMGAGHGYAMDKTRDFLVENGFTYDPGIYGNVSPAFRKQVKKCYEKNNDPFCGRPYYP